MRQMTVENLLDMCFKWNMAVWFEHFNFWDEIGDWTIIHFIWLSQSLSHDLWAIWMPLVLSNLAGIRWSCKSLRALMQQMTDLKEKLLWRSDSKQDCCTVFPACLIAINTGSNQSRPHNWTWRFLATRKIYHKLNNTCMPFFMKTDLSSCTNLRVRWDCKRGICPGVRREGQPLITGGIIIILALTTLYIRGFYAWEL